MTLLEKFKNFEVKNIAMIKGGIYTVTWVGEDGNGGSLYTAESNVVGEQDIVKETDSLNGLEVGDTLSTGGGGTLPGRTAGR